MAHMLKAMRVVAAAVLSGAVVCVCGCGKAEGDKPVTEPPQAAAAPAPPPQPKPVATDAEYAVMARGKSDGYKVESDDLDRADCRGT